MTSRLDRRFKNSRLSRQSQQQLLEPGALSEKDKNLLLNPALVKELRKTKKKIKGRKGKKKKGAKKQPLEIAGNLGVVVSLSQRRTSEEQQEAKEKQKLVRDHLALKAQALQVKQQEQARRTQTDDHISQREFVARAGESRARAEADRDRLAFDRQRHNDEVVRENRRIDADIVQLNAQIDAEERSQVRQLAEGRQIRQEEADARREQFEARAVEQDVNIRLRDIEVAGELEQARLRHDEALQEGVHAHERETRVIDNARAADADRAALDTQKQQAYQSELDFLHRERAGNEELRVPREEERNLSQADRRFLEQHSQALNAHVDTGLEHLRTEFRQHNQRTEADQARRDQTARALPEQLRSDIRDILQPVESRVSQLEEATTPSPELRLSPAESVRQGAETPTGTAPSAQERRRSFLFEAGSEESRRTPRSPEATRVEAVLGRLSRAERQLQEVTGVPKFTGTPTSPAVSSVSTLRADVETPERTLSQPEPEAQPILRRQPPRAGEQFGGGLLGQGGEVIVGLGQEIPTEREVPEGILVGRGGGTPPPAPTEAERQESLSQFSRNKSKLTDLANTQGAGRRSRTEVDELRKFRITNMTDRSIGGIGAGESVRVVGTRTSTERSPSGRFQLREIVSEGEAGGGRRNTRISVLETQIAEGNFIFQYD